MVFIANTKFQHLYWDIFIRKYKNSKYICVSNNAIFIVV